MDTKELLKYAMLCKYARPTMNHQGVEAAVLDRVLIIKGSNERRDWYRNINILKYTNMHLGFKRAVDYLDKAVERGTYDIVVGHSQGGAIAQLMGIKVGLPAVGFGSPMVSDGKLGGDFTRVVNCNDWVARLPGFGGYKHSGTLVYLSYSGEVMDRIATWDWFRGRLKAWSKKEWFSGVYDHGIDRYIGKLKYNQDGKLL